MNTSTTTRGSILLYAMLVMAIMLIIGTTLTALFASELRVASLAQQSVLSLYVADSAAEKCLYEARTLSSVPALSFASGATYEVINLGAGMSDLTVTCEPLGSSSFGFRATGTHQSIRRSLEISQ